MLNKLLNIIIIKEYIDKMLIHTSFLGERNSSIRTSDSSTAMGSGFTAPSVNSVILIPLANALEGLGMEDATTGIEIGELLLQIKLLKNH
jgi:hypothetical protein